MTLSELLCFGSVGKAAVMRPERLEAACGKPLAFISIDGGSATGKSRLSALLCEKLGFEQLHMDDFFLPTHMRTPERLAEPGGNLDRERFIEQVLPHLGTGEAFSYDVFDCSSRSMCGRREIRGGTPLAVEGAYSNHPAFGSIYDLRIFLTCSEALRRERIIGRNGEAAYKAFEERWIPMENAYFSAFSIMENADVVIDTSEARL